MAMIYSITNSILESQAFFLWPRPPHHPPESEKRYPAANNYNMLRKLRMI